MHNSARSPPRCGSMICEVTFEELVSGDFPGTQGCGTQLSGGSPKSTKSKLAINQALPNSLPA